MSKKAKKHRITVPAAPSADKRSAAGKTGIALTVAIAAFAAFLWLKPKHPGSPSSAAAPAQAVLAPASQPKADFQRLKGSWVRPDGGYVVEVRGIEDTGRMDMSYFNPRSIHVARAEASQDGAATKVFIELRDVNYPGSTYTLAYNPQADRLEGIYYQAVLQQSFEVIFLRTK
jgi:hypothetical protein